MNNLKKIQTTSSSLYSNFILNAYIVCELNNWSLNHINNFSLESCLFCTVKFIRKKIKSEFTYNIWEISFHRKCSWSFGNEFARNIIIFGADNSSSSHTNNWKNSFLVIGEWLADGITDSTGAAEKSLILTLVKQMQNSV